MITGAASPEGQRYCRELAQTMHRVIAVTNHPEALVELHLDGLTDWHILPADLGTTEGQTRALEAIRQLGPLACLVNCSEPRLETLNLDTTLAEIRRSCEAVARLSQAALGFMREHGGGEILQLVGGEQDPISRASAAFVREFSAALCAELKDQPQLSLRVVEG